MNLNQNCKILIFSFSFSIYFIFIYLFFIKKLQKIPVMSRQGSRKNHTLSKEELEVNEACFGPSGSEADKFSEPATPSPGQDGNKILQTGSINQLAEV